MKFAIDLSSSRSFPQIGHLNSTHIPLSPSPNSLVAYVYKETLDEKLVMPDEKIVIKTKHGELSLEQLAEAQHGMAHLMKEVGERYHVLYYAAKAFNWKLAQYQLNHVIALFRIGATLRPKFTEDLNEFVRTHFHPMSEAIRTKDWKRFEDAFTKGIQASDQFHEKFGYGYIHFVLPKNPPEMYDLAPRE